MKRIILPIIMIGILLLAACNSEHKVSGEVIEWTMNEDTGVSAFVVQTEGGKQVGIIVSDNTSVWSSDIVSADDFRHNEQDGVFVSVVCEKGMQKLKNESGAELTAYTADVVRITGLLNRGAFTVSDGTKIDLFQFGNATNFSNCYQLEDGTKLLYERSRTGPENVYVGGLESLDDLNEKAKENVSAYYADQGLLYDVQEILERAYQDYVSHEDRMKFNSQTVGQEISPSASSDRVMYFLTTVTLPVEGNICTEMRLGAAFDRETGNYIIPFDLFSCGETELIEQIITIAEISDSTLQSEIKAAFQPEYIIFFQDSLEVNFPKGTLASQEHSYGIWLDYDERLTSILHDWAIPEELTTQN